MASNIRKLSTAEINQMNKDTLKNTSKEIMVNLEIEVNTSNTQEGNAEIMVMLQQLLEEVKALRAEGKDQQQEMKALNDKVTQQGKDIDDLHKCNSNLIKAVEFNQQMFERMDNKERACNAIITGLMEENPLDGASTDEEKCDKIFEKIDLNIDGYQIKRLGKKGQYPRPVLVLLKTPEQRKLLLGKAKKLKDADDTYKKIYIKKDTHPAIRKEWRRLKAAEKEEKEKPENVGCLIKIDYRRRVLLKDEMVIDKWNPWFFQ